MTGQLYTGNPRATNANNAVLPGAKLYFYATGTTTPQSVYADSGLTTPLANPVVADAGGLFVPIYMNPSLVYRARLTDSSGTVVYDIDPFSPIADQASRTDLASSATGKGASLIGTTSGQTAQAVLNNHGALLTGRTAPHTNFAWFTSDFTVTGCQGAQRAAVQQDVADVFQTKFGGLLGATVSYVHPNGSDANGGTSWRDAFLTVAKAVRNTANGTIYIWPGTYALSDFRYTDTSGTQPKKIIAPYGNVTLRVIGDQASAATWILDGDYGGIYSMCAATTNVPIRVLHKDLSDKYGNPLPIPYIGNRAALAGVNYGWSYDASASISLSVTTTNGSTTVTCGATKNATVGMAITGTGIPGGATISAVVQNTSITLSAAATASGSITATATGNLIAIRDAMNANVNTNKANFDIVYGDASGDARTLIYSATSYWEGITFYGYISVLHAVGQATPQFWAKKCKFFYGNTHELLVQGGYSYTQDCIGGYGAADGANYNIQDAITARGVEINYTTYYQGDVLTYGIAQTLNPQGNGANKNGSSNHDSYVVRINGAHYDCYGPNIADTSPSYSWNMGVFAGYNAIAPNSIPSNPRYGFLNQGNNAWLDGCAAIGQDAGFNSDSSAVSNVYNCFGTQSATNSGTFVAYTPS